MTDIVKTRRLLTQCGLTSREKREVIDRYRPTLERLRVVVANLAAIEAELGDSIPSPKAFVVSSLHNQQFTYSDLVLATRERARQRNASRKEQR